MRRGGVMRGKEDVVSAENEAAVGVAGLAVNNLGQ